jgi:hypothetical protein
VGKRGKETISEEALRIHAYELFRAGHDMAEIARQVRKTTRWVADTVRQAMAALVEARAAAALDAREVELARIDALYAEASAIAHSRARLDGELEAEVITPERRLRAVAECRALSERRSKLLGLDAPARQEVSGPDGGPIPVDARDEIAARIARIVRDS